MEKTLKDIVGPDTLENLLKSIQESCMSLIKYKPLFKDGSDESECKYYENRIRDIYKFLIMQCKFFLADYYREKIENIYSKAGESLPWTDETTAETEETVKTVETVETEEETDEES